MSLVRCPHCGEVNFTIVGWANLDRCARCGKSLATRDPHSARSRVQERMSSGTAEAGGRTGARAPLRRTPE